MKLLADAGWTKLQENPFAYTKSGYYLLHAKAVRPDSLVSDQHPWVLERSQGYLLIRAKDANIEILNHEPDLQKLLVIVKLMGLL